MDQTENRLHHLSHNQLKALFILAKSEKGIISSTGSSNNIGKKGKSLGGIFSSLSRQIINGSNLVIPWGKADSGRGLYWKLNEKLITKDRLLQITAELLAYA